MKKTSRKAYAVCLLMTLIGIEVFALSNGLNELNNNFRIDSKILIAGKIVSNPRIIAVANEIAIIEEVSDDESSYLKIQITANEATQIINGINLNMIVDYRAEGRNVHVEPKLIVKDGEEAVVTLNLDHALSKAGVGSDSDFVMRLIATHEL